MPAFLRSVKSRCWLLARLCILAITRLVGIYAAPFYLGVLEVPEELGVQIPMPTQPRQLGALFGPHGVGMFPPTWQAILPTGLWRFRRVQSQTIGMLAGVSFHMCWPKRLLTFAALRTLSMAMRRIRRRKASSALPSAAAPLAL